MRYAYLLFQDIGPEKPMACMQERRMEIQKKDDWKRKRKKLAPVWLLLLSIGAFSPAYRVEAAPAAADGVRAEEDSAGYGIEKKKAEIPADGTEKEPLEAPAGLRRGSLTYHSVKLSEMLLRWSIAANFRCWASSMIMSIPSCSLLRIAVFSSYILFVPLMPS